MDFVGAVDISEKEEEIINLSIRYTNLDKKLKSLKSEKAFIDTQIRETENNLKDIKSTIEELR